MTKKTAYTYSIPNSPRPSPKSPQKGDVSLHKKSNNEWEAIFYDGSHWFTSCDDAIDTETPEEKRLRKLEEGLEAIKERLAILDDPNPEKLEKHKMLRDAYNKYKMIEKLIGDNDE